MHTLARNCQAVFLARQATQGGWCCFLGSAQKSPSGGLGPPGNTQSANYFLHFGWCCGNVCTSENFLHSCLSVHWYKMLECHCCDDTLVNHWMNGHEGWTLGLGKNWKHDEDDVWCPCLKMLWCHVYLNLVEYVCDEGLTPTKDGGTCLRRLSMFRKEVH